MPEKSFCIALASDHAGFAYKEEIKKFLQGKGFTVSDFGTHSEESVDYPLFIRPAALAVSQGECRAAVILGGSGNGEAMVANKVKGVRCAVCWNILSARLAKEHNNANMISLGQRMVSIYEALSMVEVWLNSDFHGGRHQRRIRLIDEMEQEPDK